MGSRARPLGIPLPSGYIDKTDTSFTSFLATGPNPDDLQRYVFDHYYVVALSHAYHLSGTRVRGNSDERDERSLQLAYKVMTDLAESIKKGSFSYRASGGAPFSAYLRTAVQRAAMNPFRIKVPTEFLKQGSVARDVYCRVFRGHESDRQIRADLFHNHGLSETTINRLLSAAHEYIARTQPVDHIRRIAGSAADVDELSEVLAGTAEEQSNREIVDAVHAAIDRLDPVQRELTAGYYFGSQKLKEIGRKYGVKNPVYEKKKAVERLRNELQPFTE